MAKEVTDITTQDLFSQEKRLGRPRTNMLSRNEQLKLNKRRQVKRDNANGLKRIELKVDDALFSRLNQDANSLGIKRSILIEQLLRQQLQMTAK